MNARSTSDTAHTELHVAIASSFTIEPIESPLSFWLERLGLPHAIRFAPYNQVFQQLLDPASLFTQNGGHNHALNLIYLRLQDWLLAFDLAAIEHDAEAESSTESVSTNRSGTDYSGDVACVTLEPLRAVDSAAVLRDALQRNAEDLVKALKVAALKSSVPTFLVFCAPAPDLTQKEDILRLLADTEEYIVNELAPTRHIQLIRQADVGAAYPVEEYYDEQANKAGHVPYTEPYFAALAGSTVRRYNALTHRPFKVIALDCDNTLWAGVCGEEGPLGVQVTEAHRRLQAFMLAQKEAGMLLCLCSKNVEKDVFAVFEHNEGMVLEQTDIVASRINWEPKSANLQSLAHELNLGLDSFIFLDDNPIECAEVNASCPGVATLQLPTDAAAIDVFLENAWPFDRLNVTAEDQQRAAHYQQNVLRERLRESTTSLEDFLATLNVSIAIERPEPAHYPRLAQLTQRTNQFNSTTIRRTETDIERALSSGSLQAVAVHVSDRFGDYGLVGFALYTIANDALQIDSFMLSCRALGRGVEQSMMKHLAEQALAANAVYIDAAFSSTEKNRPVLDFFERVADAERTAHPNGDVFRYRAGDLAQLDPLTSATPSTAVEKSTSSSAATPSDSAAMPVRIDWQEIAGGLSDIDRVVAALHARTRPRPDLQATFLPARSALESTVIDIWKAVLKIERIGLDDGFKELGGSSLHLVQINSLLYRRLNQKIPLTKLFTMPTPRAIVQHLSADPNDPSPGHNAIQQRAARQKAAMANRKDLRKRLR